MKLFNKQPINTPKKGIELKFEHIRKQFYRGVVFWNGEEIQSVMLKESEIKDFTQKFENLFRFDDTDAYMDLIMID